MKDTKLDRLIDQVKHNCNVSDAKYGGNLSLCNMLLRLRQLYYHEHGLKPWESADNYKILDWIGKREALWDSLEIDDYHHVEFNEQKYDPFDVSGINELIQGTGYVYGAGYGIFGKPQFFLARMDSIEKINNNTVYHLNSELCTDLLPAFALSQNNYIYIRRESLVDFLFYKFRDRKSGSAMDIAFSSFGLNQRTQKKNYSEIFLSVADAVEKIFVFHEISEIDVRNEFFSGIFSTGMEKHDELALRAIKDAMADFSDEGTLSQLIRDQDGLSILFFSAFMNDYYQHLIPEISRILHNFHDHPDFILLENKRVETIKKINYIFGEICYHHGETGFEGIKNYLSKLRTAQN